MSHRPTNSVSCNAPRLGLLSLMLCYQDERLQGKEIWQLLTVSLQGMSWAGKCSNLHPQASPRTSCQFFLQYSVHPLLILSPGNSLCSSQDLISLPMSHRHQLGGSLTYNTRIPNSAQISSHQYPIASMEHPTCSQHLPAVGEALA